MHTEPDSEQLNRSNFRHILHAFSSPGEPYTIQPLFGSPLLALASVLLYSEVHYHETGIKDFSLITAMTGSQIVQAEDAHYCFCAELDQEILSQARIGTPESPELGATVVAGCKRQDFSQPVQLRGPGIKGTRRVELPLDKQAITLLQEKNSSFPMGIDLLLVADDLTLIGLPRTSEYQIL